MRLEKTIRDQLEVQKKQIPRLATDDQKIRNEGWIAALEWVLEKHFEDEKDPDVEAELEKERETAYEMAHEEL